MPILLSVLADAPMADRAELHRSVLQVHLSPSHPVPLFASHSLTYFPIAFDIKFRNKINHLP